MADKAEVAVLQVKIQHLEARLQSDAADYEERIAQMEAEFRRRLKALEARSDELEARIRLGKGIFIGVVLTLGSLGAIAFDRARLFLSAMFK